MIPALLGVVGVISILVLSIAREYTVCLVILSSMVVWLLLHQRWTEAMLRKSNEKLIESNEKLQGIFEATFDGILFVDARTKRFFTCNPAFSNMLGYSHEELFHLGIEEFLIHHDVSNDAGRLESIFCIEAEASSDMLLIRKDGSTFHADIKVTHVDIGRKKYFLANFRDITERKRIEEENRNLAFYDVLTGLPNRRLLLERLKSALTVSARSHRCGALLFLDMDKFKILNDTRGHDYGDLMLVEVGKRIRASVREVDTVSRIGGDEFVVLLEEIDENMQVASQRAALVAEKIRIALTKPYMLKGHEFHSSPSVGVSMYLGNEESVDTLMKNADMAMYQVKEFGRNAVLFFDPMMQLAVSARAEMEADLRGALQKQQFQLQYQLQVDNNRRPIGAEVLIRWKHPWRGMVSPALFIPIAEESGLILDIGFWVIETACSRLAEWAHDEQMSHLNLAVNVSARQFRQQDFVKQLGDAIARHRISPERLKLELTESVVLADVTEVVSKMHQLKALGVKLSLDDFGTGYSSLAYLKQLPLDQLKIDQSFVRDITIDPTNAVMVKTIIGMGHNFRLNVIAEGVETEAQLDFLRQNECMAYQGYLFSKPIPVDMFEAMLKQSLL